jgi:hypothetical protein
LKKKSKLSKGTSAAVARAKAKKKAVPFYEGTWLQDTAGEWQRLLKLADWEIHVAWAEPCHMGAPERIGECQPSIEHRGALIKILHPKFFDPAGYGEPDQMAVEHTIVHELLHIPFAWCEGKDTRERDVEQAINAISHALITQKFGKKFSYKRN